MAHQATGIARSQQNASNLAGLARFFPESAPLRLPVHLTRTPEGTEAPDFSESTVIEFGTSREVLFTCKAHLDFADELRVQNVDGSFDEMVSVVAVQYHPGNTYVAARFRRDVPNWIVKS